MERNVEFHPLGSVPDETLLYAVVAARYKEQWLFCRQKGLATWELPGGKRDAGETILQAAHRELVEETGAKEYTLAPVCVYHLPWLAGGCGLLCRADITALGPLPAMEMEAIALFDEAPEALTWPDAHPAMLEKVRE